MMGRLVAVVFLASIVAASGSAGSFYLAGAQETSADSAEISVGGQARSGSEIEVSGSNFTANSEVSIYLMSAVQTELGGSDAFILQEVGANESAAQNEGGGFFEDALGVLEDLLGSGEESEPSASAGEGSLLVVLAGRTNGTLNLECAGEEVAEDNLDNTNLVSLASPAGTQDECSISISENNSTETGELGSLTVVPDQSEGYETSLVSNATADGQGSFAQSVQLPEVEQGEYAILAISEEGTAAVSGLSVSEAPAEVGPETGTQNQTALVSENVTSDQNQTGTSAGPNVVLEESEAEQGKPLAIGGDGFEPNTPVQVFINNVQITNIITNIEGSFNTVVIVPTTVNTGSAEVTVRTNQTNIVENVSVIQPDGQNQGPASVRFTSVSATDNAQSLAGAPVTVFDTENGEVVETGKTPMAAELEAGTYSVFYSDFDNHDFESAEPGRWTDTDDGGSGLITVKAGRNLTVTAMYSEEPEPSPPPRETENSITLRAETTEGEALEGMFVTVYDGNSGEKIVQGFTELAVDGLPPGAYPLFFANFAELEFVSATPGSWVQTPFGGAGFVSIPDDGQDHDIVATAVYERITEVAEEPPFNIQAPLDVRGDLFSITSNETRPEGPFVVSGSFALKVDDEDPLSATLSAYMVSVREDSNDNVFLDSQRSRDHDTFQIVDLDPSVARPVGINSYVVSGTADLLLNGDMYSNDERIQVMMRGGDEMAPTNVEIEFQGDHRYSAANRLETLYGAVTAGFQ